MSTRLSSTVFSLRLPKYEIFRIDQEPIHFFTPSTFSRLSSFTRHDLSLLISSVAPFLGYRIYRSITLKCTWYANLPKNRRPLLPKSWHIVFILWIVLTRFSYSARLHCKISFNCLLGIRWKEVISLEKQTLIMCSWHIISYLCVSHLVSPTFPCQPQSNSAEPRDAFNLIAQVHG